MNPVASSLDSVGFDPDAERLRRYVAASSTDRGDADRAFEELVASAGPALHAYVTRFLGCPASADDVTQQIWINVARNGPRFDGRAKFSTWLYRIARNACVDHLRRRRRQAGDGAASRPMEDLAAPGLPPDEAAAQRETAARIMGCVARLPDSQREVFLMREEAGLSFDEIGEALGCGRETAKSRMRYALERLRAWMGAR